MSATEQVTSPERTLCGLLMQGRFYEDAVRECRETDFVEPAARKVFSAVGELVRNGHPTDPVTVAERLPSNLHPDVMHMASISLDMGGQSNVIHFARMVQRGARRRILRDTLTRGLERIDQGEEIDQIAEEVSQTADATFAGRDITPTLPKLLTQSATSIERAYLLNKEQGFVGESYTLPELDARLGGLWGTSLVVIGARTSVGKSTFGWQIALEAARRGSPAGIIDTEMGAVRAGIRIMSYYYALNNTKLRLGIEDEVRSLLEKAEHEPLHEYPLHLTCDHMDLYSIMGQIGRWKREHDIRFAVVDYLQKIDVPGVSDPFKARGVVTKELQRQSQRLDIPIILTSQLNRSVERENRPPMLSDLRESGNIEQDADLVIALHGKLDADEKGDRDLEIHILKAKDFRTGKVPVRFRMHGATYSIHEGLPF